MFRDEDLAYALRLGQAGVPVEFHLHPGAPHEFDFIAFNTTAARSAIADRVLSSTGCPCPSPVAAVQPALINESPQRPGRTASTDQIICVPLRSESVSTRRVNTRR